MGRVRFSSVCPAIIPYVIFPWVNPLCLYPSAVVDLLSSLHRHLLNFFIYPSPPLQFNPQTSIIFSSISQWYFIFPFFLSVSHSLSFSFMTLCNRCKSQQAKSFIGRRSVFVPPQHSEQHNKQQIRFTKESVSAVPIKIRQRILNGVQT